MRLGYGLGLAVLMALAACMTPQGGSTGDAGDAAPLAGTLWQLTSLKGRGPVTGAAVPTLEFSRTELRASGNAGCNLFNGPYVQDGASLSFGPLASTRRACADEAATAQETAYLQALQSTTRFTRTAGELVLYAGDQVTVRFRPSGR
jgi:heat shock protein HslJ